MRKDQYYAACAEAGESPKWCYLGQMLGAGGAKALGASAPIFEATQAGTLVPVAAAKSPLFDEAILRQLMPLLAMYGAASNRLPLMGTGLAGMMMLRDRPISSGKVYQK